MDIQPHLPNDTFSMQVAVYEAFQSFHRELTVFKSDLTTQLKDYTPRSEFTQRIASLEEMSKKIIEQSADLRTYTEKLSRDLYERIMLGDRDLQTQILKIQLDNADARTSLEKRLGEILIAVKEGDKKTEEQVSEQRNFLDNRALQWAIALIIAVITYFLGHYIH